MSTPPSETLFAGDAAARRVEALYRIPDILAQRVAIRTALALTPGERELDVGCGPGLLCAEMAGAVGSAGTVVGVDTEGSMLRIDGDNGRGLRQMSVRSGEATSLPADDAAFDAVVCTQVLEHVPDVAAALAEFRRVLRPGGGVLIVDTDWTSCVRASADDARMCRIISAWDAHCAHPRLPRTLPTLLAAAGFDLTQVEALPLLSVRRSENTYCEGMTELIARFVARSGGVAPEEAASWRDGKRKGRRSSACPASCFSLDPKARQSEPLNFPGAAGYASVLFRSGLRMRRIAADQSVRRRSFSKESNDS
jgi:arsenite methyltransferase